MDKITQSLKRLKTNSSITNIISDYSECNDMHVMIFHNKQIM